MDLVALLDVFVILLTSLCVALLLYGAWLCLPIVGRKPAKGSQDETESEAVVRLPRPRVRAGTGGR